MTGQPTAEKIGILGGTFDPIHLGHMLIAREAQRAAGLQRVIILPTGTPPHKEQRVLSCGGHRLAMARLAAVEQGFEVSDLEICTPGVDYTVDTLKVFRAMYKEAKLYFIIGGDSLMYLDQWRSPGVLLRLAAFIAVYRPGNSLEELRVKREELLTRFGGKILLIACEGTGISSTELRAMAAAGQDISTFVPAGVADYIRENNLYR